MMEITFTLDLEDHRVDQTTPGRFEPIVRQLVDYLDEHNIRGTIFVVGSLARRNPGLISYIAEAGHEIAYHSRDHLALDRESIASFKTETREDVAFLEDTTGQSVAGYRAPVFSLTARTMWVVDALTELGFAYSSSVLPSTHPLHGFPEAPDQPFRWSSGLIELPVPVHRILGRKLPYLGGVYLRYLPSALIQRWAHANASGGIQWTYCHPYDFDSEEPFCRIKGAGLLTSLILWFNRSGTWAKLDKAIIGAAAPPLRERVTELEQTANLIDFTHV